MLIDYTENICNAVDIIVKQRLSEMKFDETIKCKIIEVINQEKGEYSVLYNDTLRFTAYAEEDKKYREGTFVYVLVPKGDYTQDKIIQGKYSSSDQEEPVTFISPLENIEKVQDIYSYENQELYLTANGEKKEIDFVDEVTEGKLLYVEDENLLAEVKYLCISAEFKTILNGYDIRQGDYGLKIAIFTNKGIYDFSLGAETDMFGNPYQYRSFQKQEQVYNISFQPEETISAFGIIFYQNDNFKYYNGIDFDFQKLQPSELFKDIAVQNINIYFGKDKIKKEENLFEILTQETTEIDPNKNYVIEGTIAQKLLEFLKNIE